MTDWLTITFTLDDVEIELGWLAFAKIGYWLASLGLTAGQLAYRWHREEPDGITANFEVLKTP